MPVGFNTPGTASSAADFGEVWGGFWERFGSCLAFFFKALLPRGPKRVQEAAKRPLGLDLAWFWTGFGKGLGDQNGQKIDIFTIFLICFSKFNFGRILFDFC